MERLRLPCILSFALSLAACNGGSKTDETGDGDNELIGGACGEETETIVEDILVTPTGFELPVNELLAPLEGDFTGSFTWYETDGPRSAVHAGTNSPLTAALAYSGGTVRLIEREKAGELPDVELGKGDCANYLVVDMILEFATEDGLFAESLVVPLTVPGPESDSPASIYHSLDLDMMAGTLGVDDLIADDTITDVVLFSAITTAGLTGQLMLEVTVGEGPDSTVGFGSIAEYDAPRIP